MKSADYPEPFRELARELRRLPGIGPRTAERIALWLVSSGDAKPPELAASLRRASENLRSCEIGGFFSTEELCEICRDEERIGREICVVEQATTPSREHLPRPLSRPGRPVGSSGPHWSGSASDRRIARKVQRERPSEIILALSADAGGGSDHQLPFRKCSRHWAHRSLASPMVFPPAADWNRQIR